MDSYPSKFGGSAVPAHPATPQSLFKTAGVRFQDFVAVREFVTPCGRMIRLRPATDEDASSIVANITKVCTEEIYLQTDTFKLTPAWANLFAINGMDWEQGELLLVAQDDEQAIGHARIYPGMYGSKDRHVAQLGMALVEGYRNRGIGSAMLDYVLEWCPRAGYRKIQVHVIGTNDRALHLFQKFGFRHEGYHVQQLLIRGEYVDKIILAFPCTR